MHRKVGNMDSTVQVCDDLQKMYLADNWSHPPGTSHTAFQCLCDLQKVCKLSVKCVCVVCGSTLALGRCSNKTCDGQDVYKFTAKCRYNIGAFFGITKMLWNNIHCNIEFSNNLFCNVT